MADFVIPELLAILALNGLVAFADRGLIQVLPNTEARQLPTPVVSPDNLKTLDGEIITCIITVKYVSAAQLVPMPRPKIPAWGHLAAPPDPNARFGASGRRRIWLLSAVFHGLVILVGAAAAVGWSWGALVVLLPEIVGAVLVAVGIRLHARAAPIVQLAVEQMRDSP